MGFELTPDRQPQLKTNHCAPPPSPLDYKITFKSGLILLRGNYEIKLYFFSDYRFYLFKI